MSRNLLPSSLRKRPSVANVKIRRHMLRPIFLGKMSVIYDENSEFWIEGLGRYIFRHLRLLGGAFDTAFPLLCDLKEAR